MTAINFPDSPEVNEEFTAGTRTWKWNGSVWETVRSVSSGGGSGATGATGPQGPTGPQGEGFDFKGEYYPTGSYNLNDVVSYNGSTYIALTTGPTAAPLDTGWWALLASKGATGASNFLGAVMTLPESANYGDTVFHSMEYKNYVYTPAGWISQQGAQGPTGPQGVQGPTGPAGSGSGGSSLIVEQYSVGNGTTSASYVDITALQFDQDSGFAVTNPYPGVARVAMNSTFKYWQVNGVQKLTAEGLDTVNFVAGEGITIAANGTSSPQSITITSSAAAAAASIHPFALIG